MSDTTSSRRKFLQTLGLTAGAAITGHSVLAQSPGSDEIRKLTPEQQAFMEQYEHWMNEYIEVIKVQKTSPDNLDNHKKMIVLTEQAETFKPLLDQWMQDETFSLIYRVSIERMAKEI